MRYFNIINLKKVCVCVAPWPKGSGTKGKFKDYLEMKMK